MNLPAPLSTREARGLVLRAQMLLGLTHEAFGNAIGVSKRTSTRIAAGQSSLVPTQYARLARLVHPRDAALAALLAAEAGGSLESLGIVAAKRTPTAHLVDSVVCAAADALNAPPAAVRAAVHAAFRRAREMHLAIEDVEGTLAAAAQEQSKAAEKKAKG